MCKDCCKDNGPDRGSVCLEAGCYLLNFNGCHECRLYDTLDVADRRATEHDEDGAEIETITFTHICKRCKHVVAQHKYTFEVVNGFQEYTMSCRLCGRAADSRSVQPNDPNRDKFF